MNHLKLETCFAYVAGDLTEVESLAIELHLAKCEGCAAQVREARAFDGILDDIAAVQLLRPPAQAFDLQEVLIAGLKHASTLGGHAGKRVKEWLDVLPTPGQVAAAAVRIVVDATSLAFELGGIESVGQGSILGPLRAFRPALAARGEQAPNVRDAGGSGKSHPALAVGGQSARGDLELGQPREVYAIGDAMAKIVIDESGAIEARVADWPDNLPPPLLILIPLDPNAPPQVQELKAVEGRDYVRARFPRPPLGEYLLAFAPEKQ